MPVRVNNSPSVGTRAVTEADDPDQQHHAPAASGQIKLRRIDGWRKIAAMLHRAVAASSALAAVLAVGVLFAPVMAKAQPKDKWVIGVLGLDSPPADFMDAFRETLRERGYLEGRNVTFQERWADSRSERLDELAGDLVRLKVDVILVDGTPAALTAKRATREIPIVFPVAGDPIGDGLVASLARPGGNATGLSVMVQELYPKRFELIRQMFPGVERIALLTNLGNPGTVSATKAAEDAARSLKLDLRVFDARRQDEIEPAFAEIVKQRVGVLIITANGVFNSQLPRLFALTMKYRLPTMLAATSKHKDFLIEFGVDLSEHYRRAAVYVDKILKGARPTDLPVEQPTEFRLVVNLKTAKALGLTIPTPVLLRANQVIE